MQDRIARAEESFSAALLAKTRNVAVTFNWLSDSRRFWFKQDCKGGHEFFLVDAATGTQSPAFDHQALADALRKAGKPDLESTCLPITAIDFQDDDRSLHVALGPERFTCDLTTMRCSAQSVAPDSAVHAPDGHCAIFRKDEDLWLWEARTGDERRLTEGGIPNFAYGDIDNNIDFGRVVRRRHGVTAPLTGIVWDPDGRRVLALRQDLRGTPERLIVTEYVAPDTSETILHSARLGVAGDPERPDSRLAIIDIVSGTVRELTIDPQAFNDWALIYFFSGILWWSADSAKVHLITANRGGSHVRLTEIDLASGASRDVISETGRFNVRLNSSDYAVPNVHVTKSGDEAIWFSERDGHGHLYLYDLPSGRVKRQLTEGAWVVADLLRIDEGKRKIYFTGVGREPGNPYYRRLYRVGLDGGEPELLTPEDADHDFRNGFGGLKMMIGTAGSSISPDGSYIVDAWSTVDQPPKVVLRRSDGQFIADILTADISVLQANGWRPPERFATVAADGTTELHGVLYKPRDFDPNRKYAVIDFIYPGPQSKFAPISFEQAFTSAVTNNAHAFAEMGFIVLAMDGRGTAHRSREFRDAHLGTEDVFGLADHVAAIKDLARQYPYLDLDRVGIMGGSFGGYGTLRAMLLFPEFFKVGAAAVGPGSWRQVTISCSNERFFGTPSDSEKASDDHDMVSNIHLLDRLQGKILLIYGGIDENVRLKNAFEVIDGFVKADKQFDLLIVPDAAHDASEVDYAVRRRLQYFAEHLGGSR